ncbi:dephospho-CoA kinase [Leptospira sp. 96542]|nr:dephospho-CoA kinase [Leptospira sp. 96542]
MRRKNQNKFLLGITGSIGSGKSTVLSMFGECGAVTISSDQIARQFTEKDTPILHELIEIFGNEIVDTNGNISRAKIAELAFSNQEKLQSLNAILHPKVRKQFLELFENTKEGSIVAWEVPLLFETDAHKICDATLTVYVSPDTAWERVKNRGGMPKEDFLRRVSAQMDIEKKKSLSDFLVSNDNSKEELEASVRNIYNQIEKKVIR